ncbi:hypothetical protein FOL47_010335 [Perkinsus chesapeaki]|uniref:Uncharacterized protein n=1 Tax=Perkinsus chesapeaki TaxID=330153 RepID=A0A7J6L480_PERCH|nr:hypothetical protein FOL47_010335 [Perkinsus chesapeaki]
MDKGERGFKELTLDDLVAPPGPACALDDPKLKAAYDYCDTTTAAVIDVAIRQASGLCEHGIEDQFKVIEAQLAVAMIEAEMEAYKDAMKASGDPNDMENKRRRVAIYGGTLSPTQTPTNRDVSEGTTVRGGGSPESSPDGIWNGGGGINNSAGVGGNNIAREGDSPDMSVVTVKNENTTTPKPAGRLPPRFGGGVRHHRRTHPSSNATVCTPDNGNQSGASPPPSSTDSSPAE